MKNRLRHTIALFVLTGAFAMTAHSEGMTHEIGVGLATSDVGGQDSGFALDGDIYTPTFYYGLSLPSGLAFDARLGLGDGEFTLTTGEKTDYESTRLDLRVGKSYCLSEACDWKIEPYLGFNSFSSENKLTAFGTAVEVDQDRRKIPLGAEVSFAAGANEFGIDIQLGYKFDESQKIAALAVDQDAKNDWTPAVEIFARHTFSNNVFLQAEASYVEDDFEESGGPRSATEETSTLTFSIGRKF
ncbi:MAG: hypothetical protein CME93_00990 [Hyphomonadaceae bacterium]|nr:hypothetical protein [Hyphomonadaceae bacterium]OUX95687.1 MAG: hypothetical protein CBB77_00730 [Hyphomonas sp. TMED17]